MITVPMDFAVISPQTLLQKLLDKIRGQEGIFTGIINWDERFEIKLLCGETVRKFENPQYHGSLKDFWDWMELLGYTRKFEGNTLIFSKRSEYYRPDVIAMDLGEKEVAKLEEEANDEHAYTSLEIGYKKQEYNKDNGLLDPAGTFSYLTGYNSKISNDLSRISPYRGDSLGIEYLCWENVSEEPNKDDKSDKDIFAVALKPDAGNNQYIFADTYAITAGGITLHNAELSPYFLATRNLDLLGITCYGKTLRFTATDGYRDAVLNGDPNVLYSDIPIDKRLFSPSMYYFDAGTWKNLPPMDITDGLVRFRYRGQTYKGYIKSIWKVYGSEKSANWELYAVKY
jgi:hypothetical protein